MGRGDVICAVVLQELGEFVRHKWRAPVCLDEAGCSIL